MLGPDPGDGILGHEFDKRLESFAQCFSQSLLLTDFTEIHTLLRFLKLHTKIETIKLESFYE
jgi:hypothetical protein